MKKVTKVLQVLLVLKGFLGLMANPGATVDLAKTVQTVNLASPAVLVIMVPPVRQVNAALQVPVAILVLMVKMENLDQKVTKVIPDLLVLEVIKGHPGH